MKKTPLREGRLYAMLALAFVVLAGADLLFYSTVEEAGPVANDLALTLPPVPPADLTPPGPNACSYDATIPAVADPSALVSEADYTAGNAESPVTVVEFFEPNCPHCRTFYPVMQQVIDANADKARFVIKPVIWLLSLSTNALVRLFGGDPNATSEQLSEEELRSTIMLLFVAGGSAAGGRSRHVRRTRRRRPPPARRAAAGCRRTRRRSP